MSNEAMQSLVRKHPIGDRHVIVGELPFGDALAAHRDAGLGTEELRFIRGGVEDAG